MKLVELLQRANRGYETVDRLTTLTGFYDPATGDPVPKESGDGLAEFIVTELAETFDDAATDEGQLKEAVRVIEHARAELYTVITALE